MKYIDIHYILLRDGATCGRVAKSFIKDWPGVKQAPDLAGGEPTVFRKIWVLGNKPGENLVESDELKLEVESKWLNTLIWVVTRT